MPTTPRNATDATTLGESISTFEAEGYDGQFAAREGGLVMCFACRTESPAADVALDGLIRTEGASDPADMTAVAALTCPACGVRGTVSLHYGADASPEEAEVLRDLDDRRGATGTSTSEPARQ